MAIAKTGRYVLGIQHCLPGKSNDFLRFDGAPGSMVASIHYHEDVATDEVAIARAEASMLRERGRAKPGFIVGGTLWQDERMVKNFSTGDQKMV